MRLPQMPKGNNGGFTLVELLVVLLIIVILAVGLLPLFSKDITRAQYTREGVPLISNIRTKVELYRYDKNHLPGLPFNKGTKEVYTVGATFGGNYAAMGSQLLSYSDLSLPADGGLTAGAATGAAVQWMQQVENAGSLVDMYYCGTTPMTSAAGAALTTTGDLSDHVWKCLGMDYKDFNGVRLRPQHLRYAVFGSIKDATYYWAVGCFGDGTGLKAGCGYAVVEFNDVVNKRKFVATYERYDPLSTETLEFGLGLTIGSGSSYLTTAALQKVIPLPAFDLLVGAADQTAFNNLVAEMGLAGWSVGN